ncbi:hypothetical protein J4Q44_G00217170 [Coregonus suidteri]|uniref:Uncharacterized protein n=1 Tax=Coregonus suidteri TaxID=861788 RepID=A0AAN8LUF7_9TELE
MKEEDGIGISLQQEEEERTAELNWAIRQRAEDNRDADLNVDRQGELMLSIPIPESEMGPASMQVSQGEESIGDNEKSRTVQLDTGRGVEEGWPHRTQ